MFNERGHLQEACNMEDYLDIIVDAGTDTSNIINLDGDPDFSLRDAFLALTDPAYNHMWLTIANWFNEAAGRAPYIETD